MLPASAAGLEGAAAGARRSVAAARCGAAGRHVGRLEFDQGKELPPMADEAQTIRSIHWREAFPFTHMFRAFRIAVHPSKLLLALAALLLIYAGGRLLDAAWPAKY